MPIPKQKKGEEEQEFISRCMEFLTVEKSDEFPTKEQRAAICYSQWRKSEKEKGHADDAREEKRVT